MSSPEHQQQPNVALQWAQQHPMPQRVSQLTGATSQQRLSEEYYRQMMVAQGKLPEQQRASMPAPNIERPNSQPQQQQQQRASMPPLTIGSDRRPASQPQQQQQRASMPPLTIGSDRRPVSQPQQRVSMPLPPPNIINIGSEQRPSQQFVMAQERIPVDVMRQPSVSVQRMSQQLPPPAGTLPIMTEGLQMKKLSYEGFARIYFRLSKGKMKKENFDNLLRYTAVGIQKPLLMNIGGVKTMKTVITVFAHILAYMEIIPGMNDKRDHIYQILSAGISRPDLRDEIYCQLCKQTNFNSDKEKDEKVWNLLLLCCSSFPPSREFLPFLAAHFQQVASRGLEGFKGDEEAKRCSVRLQRVAKFGPRNFLPSADEIEAIWSETQLNVETFLPDGTDQVLSVRTMTTVGEVASSMAESIGLPEPSQYGIFQFSSDGVEKLCPQQGYILDIQSGWNRDLALQPIRDWRLVKRLKYFFSKRPPINEVDDAVEGNITSSTLVFTQKGRLILKRKLFLSDGASSGKGNEKLIAFDYSQAVHEVMTGSYLLLEQDAIMLGALQLRVDLPTGQTVTAKSIDVHKYGPKKFVNRAAEDHYRAELAKTLTILPPEPSKIVCMSEYIEYLKSRCPLYQSTWFFVKQEADRRLPEEMFVAVNPTGVCFANSKTKDPILHIRFTEICSWGHSNVVMSIVTGNMTYNQDHRLITSQGAEIGATIQLFINRMLQK